MGLYLRSSGDVNVMETLANLVAIKPAWVLKDSKMTADRENTLDKVRRICVRYTTMLGQVQKHLPVKVLPAKYIGSFSVVGEDQTSRAEYVRKQLADMRDVSKSKPVLLVISLSGIKVCSSNGESVYMAHALKRISYATCDPEYCQFSFLAREPKGHTNIQYCHAFITRNSDEAEELNNIVGNAFQMAYAYQRQSQQNQQPSFNELIEKQLQEQRQQYHEQAEEKKKSLQKKLNTISTATIAERVKERKEKRRREMELLERDREAAMMAGKERVVWAKHMVGKSRHKNPNAPEEPQRHSTGSSPALQNKNICDMNSPANRASLVSIKEVFESNSFTGSPVMALKETIDSHFNGELSKIDLNSFQNGTNALSPSQNGSSQDSFIYPLTTATTEDSGNSSSESPPVQQGKSVMLNRPLPATPSGDKKEKHRSKVKGQHKEGTSRKSGGEDGSRTTSNGHHSRPVSVQYQNDTLQYGGFDNIDGSVYGGPPTPRRYDSLKKLDGQGLSEEDLEQLRQAPWYQAGVPREMALESLAQQEIGSFIVRDSTTHPGCFALSVKVPKFENPSGISHYLVVRTSRGGFRLKGLDKEWNSITSLVTHHTVMPEMLPCTLRLPRNSNNPAFKADEDKEEHDEDEDYQKLADFSSMMADLKL